MFLRHFFSGKITYSHADVTVSSHVGSQQPRGRQNPSRLFQQHGAFEESGNVRIKSTVESLTVGHYFTRKSSFFATMEKLVGNFEWGALCMPTVPWGKSTRKMPFFGRNDETPILVAVIMGLQHAFAMIGGEKHAFLFFWIRRHLFLVFAPPTIKRAREP